MRRQARTLSSTVGTVGVTESTKSMSSGPQYDNPADSSGKRQVKVIRVSVEVEGNG
jgi:hypothetical protein